MQQALTVDLTGKVAFIAGKLLSDLLPEIDFV